MNFINWGKNAKARLEEQEERRLKRIAGRFAEGEGATWNVI